MSTHASLYPMHQRTSCSDREILNATGDGQGCARCTALLLDQRDALLEMLSDAVDLMNAEGIDPPLGARGLVLRCKESTS